MGSSCCCSVCKFCLSLFATPWTVAHQASLSFSIPRSWLKFTSIESVMPYNHLILYRHLLLLPSIFSSIGIFSNESTLRIGQNIGTSASASVLPMNIQGPFFRIDWFDLFDVQGTLKSLLQHHSLKASILQCSAFFMVQLSHPYMTTGKTITLTI